MKDKPGVLQASVWRWVLSLVVLVVLTGSAAAAPASDPRTAEIKIRIERAGLKVVEVGFAPARDSAPAVWAAGTVAQYDRPSWEKVTHQALTVWNVLFAVLKKENPQTILSAPQDWKTYRLFIGTSLGKIAAFDEGARTAQTDAQRDQVFQALYAGIVFRVFDLQQQKLVDVNEFIKAHFTK